MILQELIHNINSNSINPASLQYWSPTSINHSNFSSTEVWAAPSGEFTVDIRKIRDDSRQIEPDVMFVLTGQGRPFLKNALERKPGALLLAKADLATPEILTELTGTLAENVPIFVCDNLQTTQGEIAAWLAGRPSEKLTLTGITGTNGKTSIVRMLEHIWTGLGISCGVIGTLGVRWHGASGVREIKTGYTTPRAPELQEILAEMSGDGVRQVAMEVSSEGLSLGRVAGCQFSLAVFTNLSRDHLDHHGSMENYYLSKRSLFEMTAHSRGQALIYTGDEYGERLAAEAEKLAGLGLKTVDKRSVESLALNTIAPLATAFSRINATLALEIVRLSRELEAAREPEDSGGAPNEFPLNRARELLESLPEIPGRFNLVRPLWEKNRAPNSTTATTPDAGVPEILGVVDYAHTPGALLNLLQEVRRLPAGRVVCIVGCGGDRDPGKRAPMGKIAADWSDLVILTDDNPRGEDPDVIRKEMLVGVHESWTGFMERGELAPELIDIGNRRAAIEAGVLWALEQNPNRGPRLTGRGGQRPRSRTNIQRPSGKIFGQRRARRGV